MPEPAPFPVSIFIASGLLLGAAAGVLLRPEDAPWPAGVAVLAAGAAIAYVPEAELYHFERRSITLHSGYTRTLACQYNQHLHHARWAPAMASLMQPGAAGKQA